MGTHPADFVEDPEAELPLWAQSYRGMGMDDLATGHGVMAAAEAALAQLGRSLEGAAVAIEGFGKVGAGTALACVQGGARVVGLSTVEGCIADPGGFDVEALLALRARHGDGLVRHASAAASPPRSSLHGRLRRGRPGRAAGLGDAWGGEGPSLRGGLSGSERAVRPGRSRGSARSRDSGGS